MIIVNVKLLLLLLLLLIIMIIMIMIMIIIILMQTNYTTHTISRNSLVALASFRQHQYRTLYYGIYYIIFLTYHVRPFFILRIVRPRIFESKFRNYCAKKLDGALRNLPPSFKNLRDSNSKFRDSQFENWPYYGTLVLFRKCSCCYVLSDVLLLLCAVMCCPITYCFYVLSTASSRQGTPSMGPADALQTPRSLWYSIVQYRYRYSIVYTYIYIYRYSIVQYTILYYTILYHNII